MSKIKTYRLWWACLITIAASYPIIAWAARKMAEPRTLPAPFLLSWLDVWIFAAAGGVCAALVKIPEIDKRFGYPPFAKFLIGLFSGVALSLIHISEPTRPY